MGLFSKKSDNNDILEELEAEDLIFNLSEHEKIMPNHALTADEIAGGETKQTAESGNNPLESLKARMRNSARGVVAEAPPAEKTVPVKEEKSESLPVDELVKESDYPIVLESKKEEAEINFSIDDIIASVEENLNVNTEKVVDEKNGQENPAYESVAENKEKTEAAAFVEKILDDYKIEVNSEEKAPKQEKSDEPSLLEKCMPYIIDDTGNNAAEEKPSYTLESVENILNADSDKIVEQLAKKYEVTFDNLGRYATTLAETPTKVDKNEEKPLPVKEESVPVTEVQTSLPDISDIDNISLVAEKVAPNPIEATAELGETIRFTPIKKGDDVERVVVSHSTRKIDLTGELLATELPHEEKFEPETVKLEVNDFDEFTPSTEYEGPGDLKRILRMLSVKNRNGFLQFSASLVLLLLTATFKIPVLYDFMVAYPTPCMGVCAVFAFLCVIANIDIFKSVKDLVKKKATGDISALLAVLGTGVFTATCFNSGEPNIDILLLLQFILCFRSLGKFMYASQMLSTFKSISAISQKRAVKLINEPAVTNAMAGDAVEGEALIAAPQKTGQILDFMKYSEYGTFLGGKQILITAVTLFLAVVFAFVNASVTNNSYSGYLTFASVLCFSALPTLFFIDSLPLFAANKKLKKKGAAVIGKSGAAQIEAANAVILNSSDIFPSGTITLHNMHVLGENSIDDTIIRAAALTKYIDSPLDGVFSRIVSTLNSTSPEPKVDSVKYEETRGISGWVDDKLLLIGNRTLLESHGISAPPVETDYKILRNGFFPIYVASDGEAYALLIVQYGVDPDVARELKKVTASGITVLVNSCDPNLTEEMLCDYLGLYEDSVKVMRFAGSNMYKNAVHPVAETSAPGLYKGNPTGLTSLVNCSAKIRKSNLLLTVTYILALCAGILMFLYAPFSGSGELLSSSFVLLFSIVSTVISYLLFLIEKP